MKNKTIRISALLISAVLLATLYAPIVVADANGSSDTEQARIQEIIKKLPPNPNRPTPKYIVTAEEDLAVNKLSEQMTKEKAVEIINKIPKPKDGEIIPLTLEQRGAANKILGEEISKLNRTPPTVPGSALTSPNYRHALIATLQEIYTGASNTLYAYLPILPGDHFTLLGTWFIDWDYVTQQPLTWVNYGIIRGANQINGIPDTRIWSFLEDTDEGGWQGFYDVYGNGTQVYTEIIELQNREYIVWLGNRVIDKKLHVGSLYNVVHMGGEQYDTQQQFATGEIGHVIQPQLLENTGYRYWNSGVPTSLTYYIPMREQHTETSQGYNVRIYSQN